MALETIDAVMTSGSQRNRRRRHLDPRELLKGVDARPIVSQAEDLLRRTLDDPTAAVPFTESIDAYLAHLGEERGAEASIELAQRLTNDSDHPLQMKRSMLL